jgi:hypothetical protein
LFYSFKELKKPEVLSEFRFSQEKQEIIRRWDDKRRVNEVGYIDLENKEEIYILFQQIKPLLFDEFEADFPDDPRTPHMLKIWMGQNCLAFGNMKDFYTRNIWLDLRECFLMLWKHGCLDLDEKGIVI